MPDQRSVMKEFRLLDQKRQAQGLSTLEEKRYAQLRELIGPESGAGGIKPGFDVNAAAARLRESLLPAGLRNRPPPAPMASPEPEPEPEVPAEEPLPDAAALEGAYQQDPFAPLAPAEGEPSADLFDPSSLGQQEGAGSWDPNAAYDPSAPGWDPNAPGYDANAAYDPSAPGYDPNAPGYDPNAAGYDANAAYDPSAPGYDPNAPGYDPNAAGYDANAAAYDPNDPNAAQGWDPNAPGAGASWDPGETFDPASLVSPEDGAEVAGPPAPGEGFSAPDAAAGADPSSEPWVAGLEGSPAELDPSLEPSSAPAGALDDLAPAGWDASPPAAEPAPGLELGEYDAPPTDAAPGEGSDAAGLEATLPFDPAQESAIGPGSLPEGFEAADPSIPEAGGLGEYDDTAGFGGSFPAGHDVAVPEAGGFETGEALAATGEDLQADAALEQGFGLESSGSFEGAGAPAYAAPAQGAAAGEPADALEDLPTLDGAEILEEIAPDEADALLPELEAPAAPEIAAPPPAATPAARPAPATIRAPSLAVAAAPAAPAASPARGPAAAAPASQTRVAPVAPRVQAPSPAPAAPPPESPSKLHGQQRVVVHTVEGQVKRGVLEDAELDAVVLGLAPQPGAEPEVIQTDKVKAIFFMLTPGETPPSPQGKRVRVTFRDGRQVAGFSPEYREGGGGFFVIPADTHTNTGRIWVYRSAVKTVAVT